MSSGPLCRAGVALLLAASALAHRADAADASLASADGRFVVAPKRIANGGGHSVGAEYTLDATIGQSEASGRLQGGGFDATLGLRRRALAPDPGPAEIFSNGFE